jgi:DNA-binding FadR family transcriptional regulator
VNTPAYPPMVRESTFDRVLNAIGAAIVDGRMQAGDADTVEGIEQRTGASRSIVREATRVLGSLGMLSAGRRVGLRVRPRDEWNVLDPQVIRWRLDSHDRETQLEELRDLRLAVEPEAARRAALRQGHQGQSLLVEAAAALERAASQGNGAAFLQADRELHGQVLALSGNSMFIRLQTVIEEALRERSDVSPEPHDVALHVEVAAAVGAGDADRAARVMRDIVERTRSH